MQNPEDREVLLSPIPGVYERAFRQAHVEAPQIVMLGPMTASITEIRIGGQITTPGSPAIIAVGDSFDVEVKVTANNPGIPYPNYWSICITMITTIGTLPNYDVTTSVAGADTISVTAKLDAKGKPGPMPDQDITIRIKVFGYQGPNTTPPPQNLW